MTDDEFDARYCALKAALLSAWREHGQRADHQRHDHRAVRRRRIAHARTPVRPGALDAFAWPSRYGSRLVYRDGREEMPPNDQHNRTPDQGVPG